ncbi:hypothetical protein PR048_016299 [Dryococelus australis]|uniref:Uncharacterized protein n=1 Tax=Dryococelus australis TaxID=614101 RepID=A0ABQ9HJC1_9NEOP|nr:hypothetical protein PR048_016299 [Dryococelus australis]
MQNPMAKLSCLFLESTLPIFNAVNLDSLNHLLCNWVPQSLALTSRRGNTRMTIQCRAQLKELICQVDSQTFYFSVCDFYVSASSYILDKFPLHDEFLKHVENEQLLLIPVFSTSLRGSKDLLVFQSWMC